MIIEQATTLDAEEILALQKLAYVSEAEIYNDFTIQPLHQTLNEITSEIEMQYILKHTAFQFLMLFHLGFDVMAV